MPPKAVACRAFGSTQAHLCGFAWINVRLEERGQNRRYRSLERIENTGWVNVVQRGKGLHHKCVRGV